MTEQILTLLRNTPAGREIAAQAEANARAGRQKSDTEVQRLEREIAEGVPRLDAKLAKAAKGVAEARAVLQAALTAHDAAKSERASFVAPRETRVNQLRAELRASAPPVWDELRGQFSAFYDQLCARPYEVEAEEAHTFGRTTRRVLATNRPAVERRLQAIVDVIHEIEALKGSYVTDPDATISSLWARVGGRSVETAMERAA